MDGNLEELRLRLRTFIGATNYSQFKFAVESEVSPKSISMLVNGDFVGEQVRTKVEVALDRLEPLTEAGDPNQLMQIARLEAKVDRLTARVDELSRRLDDGDE